MALLKQGSTGEDVTKLQKDLRVLGFEVETDGKFGADTKVAVEVLQTAFGYDVDGLVGDGTAALIEKQKGYGWNVTKASSLKAALEAQGKQTEKGNLAGAALKGLLKPGSTGADVRYLQRRLVALGFSVAVTGEFDEGTEKAVKTLQSAFGYTVDGKVGEGTHTLINAQIGHGWTHGADTAKDGGKQATPEK